MSEAPIEQKEENVPSSRLRTTFWALMGISVIIVSQFVFPSFRDLFSGPFLFLGPIVIFSFLGIVLISLVIKEKLIGKKRTFLLLTGISSAGFFISIFLHNFVYALFMYIGGADFWDRTGLTDEPVFFLIALILCPLGFLIGAIGSIITLQKQI